MRSAAVAALLLLATPSIARADDWPGWRGGRQEARSASPRAPLNVAAPENLVWKTPLPGEGHSSPIVAGDAVYVTTTWKRAPDSGTLVGFRIALWLALLAVAAPTLAFLGRRCAPRDERGPALRTLLALAGTGVLVLALGGLVVFGEGLLSFNRAVERGWIAGGVVGTMALTLASLFPASPRRAAVAGGLSLFAWAGLLALTIPDRAHTVSADPRSDVSRLIYTVIALPLLVGGARWLGRAAGAPLLLAGLAVGLLVRRAATLGDSLDRTISVAAPYAPRLPAWSALVPLALLGLCLWLRKRRGATALVNGGAVAAATAGVSVGLLSGAEQLLTRAPYLAYLLGAVDAAPLLGAPAALGFVLLGLAAAVVLARRPQPESLPLLVRAAAPLLALLYVVYATALPRVPHVERGIVCVDRQSGAIRWFCGGIVAARPVLHTDNSPATPTPVTDGERVYAYFGTPGLLCADRRGRSLWINRELPFESREGVASSPVLWRGRVIVLGESDAGGYLAAIDGASGRTLWRTERRQPRHLYAGNCRTPTIATVAGRDIVVVWGYEDVSAYDPSTGRMLWSRTVQGGGLGDNPVASATTDGRALFLVWPSQAACLDLARDGALVWRKETGEGAQCATPVVADGLLFAVSDNGSAYCLDTRTGAELWRTELEQQHYASPLAIGDRVYFFGTQGRVTVVACDRTLRRLAQCEIGAQIFATGAPVDGALFLRTRGHLWRLRQRAGSTER